MSASMLFDIGARDSASSEFLKVATEAEALEQKLRELDGHDVRIKVKLDTPSSAEMTRLERLSAALREIDGKDAHARVELTGVPDAKTASALRRTAKALKELDGQNAHASATVLGDLPNPRELRAAARALKSLQDVGEIVIHISVTGDVEALTRVAALKAELKSVPRETKSKVNVDVDKDGSAATKVAKLAGWLMAGGAAGTAAAAGLGSATAAAASLAGSLVSLVGMAPVAVAGLGAVVATGIAAKLGLKGMGDAFKALDDPKKFAAATKDMATEARAFAVAGRDVAPAWRDVQKSVQGAMFKGLAADLKQLSGAQLPAVKTGLTGIATELGATAHDWMTWASSKTAVAGVDQVLQATRSTLVATRPALTNISSALLDVAVVGSTRLPALGAGFAGATAKAKDFIAQARQSGQLSQWIDAGVASARQLGSVLGNVGSVAMSVYRAAKTSGADFLTTLDRGTEALARFMRSGEGQTALVAFFRESKATIDALVPGLESAAKTVAQFVQSFSASGGLQTAGKALSDLVTAVAPLGATLGTLAGQTLATLAHSASAAATAIGPLVSGVSALVSGLGPVAPAVLAAVVAFAGLQKVNGWVTAAGTSLAGLAGKAGASEAATGKLAATFSRVGSAIPILGAAIVGLVAVYQELAHGSDEAAASVLRGETSIAQARAAAADATDRQTTALGRFHEVASKAKTPNDQLTDSINQQRAALGPMQQLQSDVAVAQTTLNEAVVKFGPASNEARAAGEAYTAAKQRLTDAERGAAQATKSHTDALIEQRNAAASALGSNLDLKEALTRLSEAETAANKATREHGAGSKEAADANDVLLRALDNVALTAQRNAEAQAKLRGVTDTAKIGSDAYAESLLNQAAALSGPSQTAALAHLATLDQVTLDSLSAAAATSGLATKIVELPDGKHITVAIDPQTGKILTTQQMLDALKDKTVLVTVDGNVQPVDQAFQQVLRAVQQGRPTVTIDGKEMPALEALARVGQQAGLTKADVNINGQTVNAQQALDGFIASVKSGNPMVNIGGQDFSAQAVFAALIGTITGARPQTPLDFNIQPALGSAAQARMVAEQPVNKPLNADPAGFNAGNAAANSAGAVPTTKPLNGEPSGFNAANNGANAAGSQMVIKPLNGNPDQFNQVEAAARAAAQTVATMPIVGRDEVSSLVATLIRPAEKIINIVAHYIGFAGGGVYQPMASGGVVPVSSTSTGLPVRAYAGGGQDSGYGSYQGHHLRPMSPRAAAVPPNTYRVVGDNRQHTEVYIPLNGSKSSLAFTSYAAAAQGYGLVPLTSMPATTSGSAGSSSAPRSIDMAAAVRAGQRQASAGGVQIDVGSILAELRSNQGELRAIRAAVAGTGPGPVVDAITGLRPLLAGSRPSAAESAQARRADAELGRWG